MVLTNNDIPLEQITLRFRVIEPWLDHFTTNRCFRQPQETLDFQVLEVEQEAESELEQLDPKAAYPRVTIQFKVTQPWLQFFISSAYIFKHPHYVRRFEVLDIQEVPEDETGKNGTNKKCPDCM